MKKLLTILMNLVAFVAISQTLPYSDRIYGGSNGGIVGTIEDVLQVTPTGQLSYSIPIPTVSGTGGVKPALSIVYTGSALNGLFGYGFDLGGLSVINRAPSNRFQDNKVTTIDFTSDDRFNLDGVRLVKVWNSDSPETEYKTEKESYSYITSSGDPVNPDSFTVKTKSGLTYTYKAVGELTGGSKEKTLFWAVSRVEDTTGNYYVCEYEGEPEYNDFRIKKISYTGNSNTGLSPYASVQFTYTVNTTAAPVSYVHGFPVRHSGRVTSVRLYDGTTCVKRFQASYILKGSKYLLSEVREYDRDGKWKNPTKFGWKAIDDFHITQKDYSTTPLITKALLNVGDFNGDGLTDIINLNTNGHRILYMEKGKSSFSEKSGTFPESRHHLEVGDFNADGKSDLILSGWDPNPQGDWAEWCIMYSKGDLTFERSYVPSPMDARNSRLFVTDIDGDGHDDFITVPKTSPGTSMTKARAFVFDGFGNPYRTVPPVSTVTEITGWSTGMADAPARAVFFRYIESEGSPSSMTFLDGLGRKLRTVVEGHGGKRIYTDYAYNARGELEKSSEPYFKGDEVLWNINEYDVYGRTVSQKTAAGDITAFAYDGLTTTVTDPLGHTSAKTVNILGQQYTMRYSYNANSRIDSLIYPGGLTVRHEYDTRGVLVSVKDVESGQKYWSLGDVNARGQVTRETYGNNLTTTTAYHRYRGTIDRIQTTGVQNWEYEFDAIGNLLSRRDCIRGMKEDFGYDALNRLTEVGMAGTVMQTIEYDGAGNITYKSDVGRYQYKEGSNRLTMIKDCKADPLSWNDIKYNSWGKVTYVAIRGNVLQLAYGPSGERIHQSYADHESSYVGRYYEFVRNAKTGVSKDVNYIFNGEHLVAIVEKEQGSGNETVMYVHHDHLGSIQVLTGSLKQVLQEFSYDAWGNRRNPLTWEVYKRQDEAMALNPHGFGGHEHLDVFDMINMGGKVYDPVVGRFISADPFVQSPDIAQCFNRYAYCANNPLSLVDLSGYSWFSRNWKALTAAVVGIVVSGVTMGIGSGIAAVIISGAAGGAAASLTGALLNGANVMQVAKTTLVGAVIGGASGFLNFASADSNLLLSLMKHSFSHGWIEAVQGGNFVHGLYMGAIAKGGGYLIDTYVSGAGKIVEIAANAALSGTLDELGGGKFANGAVTGAFAMMFNELKHLAPPEEKEEMSDEQIWASALTLALTAAEIDGAAPYGDIVGASILQATALYFSVKLVSEAFREFALSIESSPYAKLNATYILKKGHIYYVGRTSGYGNLLKVLARRFYKHEYLKDGFTFHGIDRIAWGYEGYLAIRGRE